MCGRFTQSHGGETYARLFGAEAVGTLPPRYNVAPAQAIWALRQDAAGRRRLTPLHWGLIPSWSKGPDPRYSMINARVETVDSKPAYRDAFRQRRCLIPAEGFYEWQATQGRKRPWYIHPPQGLLALAGLWESWRDPAGRTRESCTILVAPAAEALQSIHPRMPVILPPEHQAQWLDPNEQDPRRLHRLLEQAAAATALQAHPVSARVNHPSNDDPALIEPQGDLFGG